MSEPSLDELERRLIAAAYLVECHGDAYLPVMERLEQAVTDAQAGSSGRARAQRILASMTLEVRSSRQFLPPSHQAS